MPRLLLVDDNPSIHKIAETLLAGTDVELACAASGADALALVHKGQTFDVAMLDISMMGMDGWELLACLRKEEATALMPVAMMAGVLDVVDPDRLSRAPIQGFLKKPVELRDLADRVRRLMETPVVPPAPEPEPEPEHAFLTSPGFTLTEHPDLLDKLTELPDDVLLLGPEDLYPGENTAKTTDVPSTKPEAFPPLEETLDLEELDLEGLRGLTLSPEEAAPEPQPVHEDFSLADDLAEPEFLPETAQAPADLPAVPDFAPGDAFPVTPTPSPEAAEAPAEDQPDFFPASVEPPSVTPPPVTPPPVTPPSAADHDFFDWSEDSDSMLTALPLAQEPAPAVSEFEFADTDGFASMSLSDILDPETAPAIDPQPTVHLPEEGEALEIDLITDVIMSGELGSFPEELNAAEELPSLAPEPAPAEVPAFTSERPAFLPVPEPVVETALTTFEDEGHTAAGLAPATTIPQEVPAVEAPAATGPADPLAALLADPVLMERLTKAVVSRLSDQTLREIAWEVMPELADRLHRNG
jgi:CheY-like chemotaxis protein